MSEEEKLEELELLKSQINAQLDEMGDQLDDETIRKLRAISNDLKDKAANKSLDQNLKDLNKYAKGLSFFQRFKQTLEGNLDIDPGRLMGLTDGIFGMVMTLLVFGIALPELQIANYSDFVSFVFSLVPTIGVTIVSFILISSFWVYHHEFIKINKLNFPYLWLNIFYLISISFIPFTTSLIGNYSHFFLSEMIFGANIFLALVFFILMFWYASSRNFLENNPTQDEKKYIYNTFFIIMGITIVVNLLDFNISGKFIYLFLLVPIVSTIRDIRFKMNK